MTRTPRFFMLLAVWGLFGLIAAHGAVLTWDGDTATPGLQDGGGTWNTADANRWWNGASYQVWSNATPDQAIFGVGAGAAGTVTLGGPITAGNITFNAPGSGNYTISGGTLTLSGSPTITANANATISSALAGTAFTKAGPGTLSITTPVAAGYTGTTVVSGGTLSLGGPTDASYNILSGGRDATVQNGATLSADGRAQNINTVTLSGGTLAGSGNASFGSWLIRGVVVPAGSPLSMISATNLGLALVGGTTFDVGAGSQLDVTGTIWNGGGTNQPLIKAGAGTMRLPNTNTYTASTTVNGGTLSISADNNLGTAPGAGTPGHLVLSGGTLQATASFALASTRGIALGPASGTGTGTIEVTGANALTYGGIIANNPGGAGGLVKSGTGTLTLTGSSTYSGGTTVAGGTVVVGATNALGTGSLTINSGTVSIQSPGFNALSNPVATVTIGAGGVLSADQAVNNAHNLGPTTLNGGTLTSINGPAGPANDGGFGNFLLRGVTVGGTSMSTISSTTLAIVSGSFDVNDVVAGTDLTISSRIISGSLTKNGAGTLLLTGANSFTGPTTINGGTLSISADNNLGTAPGAATAGHLVINGGTLQATGSFSLASTRGIALGPASGTGTGTIEVTGANALTYGGIMANNPGGTGGLVKTGTGTLTLSGLNTYTGGTTVSGGVLVLSNGGPAGAIRGALNVGAGAEVQSNAAWALGYNTAPNMVTSITLDGGALNFTAGAVGGTGFGGDTINMTGGTVKASGAGSGFDLYAGLSNYASPQTTTINVTGNSASVISANMNLRLGAAGGVVFNVADGAAADDLLVSGTISNSGGGSVTKTGAGRLTLTGANTYAAKTTVAGGTLSISADRNLGAAPTAATPGQLVLSGGTLQATASFSMANNRGIALGPTSGSGSGTIEVTGANTLVYGGVLADNPGGSGGLTKTGTGTFVVAGASAYSGPTVIAEGTLKLVNNPASSSLPVGGATLWLNATDAGKISGSGSSFVWQNSGAGDFKLVAATTTAAYSATYNPSGAGPNNLAYVNLNGAGGNTFLRLKDGGGADAAIADARTLFFVFTPTAQPAGYTPFFGNSVGEGGNYMATSGGNGYVDGSYSAVGLRPANGAVWYENAAQLASPTTAPLSVGASNYRVVDVVAGSAVTFHNLGSDRLLTGRQLAGNIGEVLVYNTALTAAQRQAVEAYLMNKWLGITAPGFGQGSLPAGTAVQIGGGATLDLNGMNQTIASLADYGGSGGTVTNTATGAPVALTIGTASGSTTFSGSVANGASAVSLVKTGASTQVLAGANTYTGATTVNGGVLQVATGGAINNSSPVNIGSASDGALSITGGAVTVGGLYVGTGAGAGNLNISSGSLTSTGFVSIAGGAGPGTWNQTGGAVNISSQVNVGNLVGGGPAQVSISGGTFTQTGGIVYLAPWSPATMTISNSAAVSLATLQFGYSGSQAATLNLDGGSLRVANGVNYGGSGPATINFNGGTFQAGGSFFASSSVNTVVKAGGAVIDTAGNTLTINTPLADGGGGGGLTKIGAGTLVLGGASTYTGPTVISGGEVQLGNQAYQISTNTTGNQTHTGSLGYDFRVAPGKTVVVTDLGFYDSSLNGLADPVPHVVRITDNVNGGTVYASATVPTGTAGALAAGYRFAALTTPVTLGPGTYRIWSDYHGVDADYNNNAVAAGPTDAGPGAALLFGNGVNSRGWWGGSRDAFPTNNDNGNVYRYGAASFRFVDPAASYLPSGTAVSITASGATLNVNSVNQTIGSLSGVAGSQVLLGSGTLTTGGSGASTTFAGAISGSGGLVKTGGGTFTLTGANTYAGPTAVTAGKLLVNGSHAGGALYTVAPGATLGGAGSITAPVQLRGAMSPGASVGTFATGAETWFNGGSFTLELDSATGTAGASPGWDLLNVNGALDLANLGPGGFRVDLVSLLGGGGTNPGPLAGFSAAPYSSYYWDFVHAGSISGFDPADFDVDLTAFAAHNAIGNSFGQGKFAVIQDGNNLVVTFTAAVPEPATVVLLVIGGLALLAWRRRLRR